MKVFVSIYISKKFIWITHLYVIAICIKWQTVFVPFESLIYCKFHRRVYHTYDSKFSHISKIARILKITILMDCRIFVHKWSSWSTSCHIFKRTSIYLDYQVATRRVHFRDTWMPLQQHMGWCGTMEKNLAAISYHYQ